MAKGGKRGVVKGSKFWHRYLNGELVIIIQKPGEEEPGEAWSRGQGPMKEEKRQKLAERMIGNDYYKLGHFNAKKGCKWFYKFDNESNSYLTKRVNPGQELPDDTWIEGRRPLTEEEKTRFSQNNLGRVFTEEWKAKMSQSSKGKPKSEAHKAAMSIAQRERNRKKKSGEL
jgi:hypothetical protein